MENLLIPMLFFLLFPAILYLFYRVYMKSLKPIEYVMAGDVMDCHENALKTSTINRTILDRYYHKGKRFNPDDYIMKRVGGLCMVPRGINPEDIVFIHKFEGDEALQVKKGDILLIRYRKGDESGYKLREFYCYNGKGNATTLRYLDNGKPNFSVTGHAVEDFIGVVKMRLPV